MTVWLACETLDPVAFGSGTGVILFPQCLGNVPANHQYV